MFLPEAGRSVGKGTCGAGAGGIPRLASRCKVDRAADPYIPPLGPETALPVQPIGLRRFGPPPASLLRPDRGNGVHRLSRARTRANTSTAGREDISPRRYASYLRVASSSQSCSASSSKSSSKESISVCANSAFCFGLSLSSSLRSSEVSRVIFVTPKGDRKVFQFIRRDCVTANACDERRAAKRSVGCNALSGGSPSRCRQSFDFQFAAVLFRLPQIELNLLVEPIFSRRIERD